MINTFMRMREILTEEFVISSWIEDLTYDDPNVIMTLGSGRAYIIDDVDFDLYEDWINALSKGKFWHEYIRGEYLVTRIQ